MGQRWRGVAPLEFKEVFERSTDPETAGCRMAPNPVTLSELVSLKPLKDVMFGKAFFAAVRSNLELWARAIEPRGQGGPPEQLQV